MVRIRGAPNTKEVGFKVSDLIFMKCTALVVECLFTEMRLLSLGEGFIFYRATVFTYTCGFAAAHISANTAQTERTRTG